MKRLTDEGKNVRIAARTLRGAGTAIQGLILKDALAMKRSAWQYLMLCALYSVFPGNWFRLLGVVFTAMIPFYSMSLDEQGRWERFALALPISRRDVVLSKYALGLLCAAAALALSLTIGSLCDTMFLWPSSRKELVAIAGIGLLAQAAILPFLFRLGPTRGRIMQMVFVGLFLGGFFVLERIGDGGWMSAFVRFSMQRVWLMLAGSAALYALSIGLSVRWYERRSF